MTNNTPHTLNHQKINEIIANRKKLLPQVDSELGKVDEKLRTLSPLIPQIDGLISAEKDEGVKEQLTAIRTEFDSVLKLLTQNKEPLQNLHNRFDRNTVNIGVSGEARVGKSTTLQKFSGLTDTQIPTGEGMPVTAVRSEIYNNEQEYAEISFRDAQEFIDDYIKPLTEIVNNKLKKDEQLSINSIADLKAVKIPATLGNNAKSDETDSFKKLKEAKESVDKFSSLLTGTTQKIELSELRRYVAYPTNDEINAGNNERAYLAVKQVKIYCKFPSIAGLPIGLIDLPGLGEIGDSIAKMHTTGLEDGVDQILPIMRPTSAKGFVESGIAKNIDQLRDIQQGIKLRGNLISAAINLDSSNQDSAKSLKDDFERTINDGNKSDKIEVDEFEAINESSVFDLFEKVIDKIEKVLPVMDQEVFHYVLDNLITDADISALLSRLKELTNKILKNIPLEDDLLYAKTNKVSSSLISYYNNLEVEKQKFITEKSKFTEKIEKLTEEIYMKNKRSISNGLFIGEQNKWQRFATGRADYINFYRDESRRIRMALIDNYTELDNFYSAGVETVKNEICRGFFNQIAPELQTSIVGHTGIIDDAAIDRIINTLDSTIRDDNFVIGFKFIKDIKFEFMINVYFYVYEKTEDIFNPTTYHFDGMHAASQAKKLSDQLGGNSLNDDEKIEKVKESLITVANSANLEIRDMLLNGEDNFNKYLFVCCSFFNDYFYRKDEKRFNEDIRRLIKAYKDVVFAGTEQKKDVVKEKLVKSVQEAITELEKQFPSGGRRNFKATEPRNKATYPATYLSDNTGKLWNELKDKE